MLFGFLRKSGNFALGQLGKMGQDCVLPLFVFFGLLAYLSMNLAWENLGHWGWFQDNVCRCSGLGQLSCGLPFDACKECLHPVGGDWLVADWLIRDSLLGLGSSCCGDCAVCILRGCLCLDTSSKHRNCWSRNFCLGRIKNQLNVRLT